jgi:glycosyltransferase involved in cell wall biosynthesis
MLLALVEEQIKLGSHSVIASIGEKGIEPKPLEIAALKKGLRLEVFRMHPGPNAAGAMKILRYAWRNHFDIIHSHGYKSNVLFGFLPRSIRKLPMVTTHHGYTSTTGFTKNRVYEWLDSIGLRFIDEVVLVNQGMLKNPRIRKFKRDKFLVIDNGIPIEEPADATKGVSNQPGDAAHPDDAAISDFCGKGFTIGSIGRLSREKGYEVLIDALCRVKERGIDAGLVIIGDGSLKRKLTDYADEKGVAEKVLLPGYRRDAWRFMPLFSVFAISSLTEGLPITLLEAMRARLPVVATAVGGVPEVLDYGQAGYLAKPGSAGDLAAGIMKLHDEPVFSAALSERAHKRLTTCYSSIKMAEKYDRVYLRHVE